LTKEHRHLPARILSVRVHPLHLSFSSFSFCPYPAPLSYISNFDEKDAFVIEKNQRNDTIHYWVKDSLLFKQDTLAMSLTYLYTDTLNQLVPRTDTLNLVSKQKYKKEEPDKDKKKKKKKKSLSIQAKYLPYLQNRT